MDRPQDPIIFALCNEGQRYLSGRRNEVSAERRTGLSDRAGKPYLYQADKTDPWSYLWVGFGGTEAQRFVRDFGLNSRQLTCECEYGEELKEIVFEMLHHTRLTAENLYYLQGKLYQFSQYWLVGLKFSNIRMIQKKAYMCRKQLPI